MPDLTQEPVKAPPAKEPESTALTAPQSAGAGNAATLAQLRSPGQLTWEKALGEKVGGRLYEALAAQLTDEKLVGHAHSAVDQAVAALKSAMAGQGSMTDEQAAALFVAEIDKALKQIAQDAVVKSGLSDGIRDFADANPYAIALAAAAGAVAYVLSNQDLPLLEGKLGLGGGHALVGGVDAGRTLSLALEQVRVGYRYDGDKVAARLLFDRYQDGYSAEGRVDYRVGAGTSVGVQGTHSDRAGEKKSRLDLTWTDPTMAASLGLESSVADGLSRQGVGGTVSSRGRSDELQRRLSGQWWSDGSWEAAAGVGRTEKNSSWSVEAFGGQDASGRENYGVRALFRLTF